MTSPEKPLPDVTDPITAPYWSATKEGKLVVPRCRNCGYTYWPPEVVCPECWHDKFTWQAIEPKGTLWSYATYHQALDAAFSDEIPYTVGLVQISDELKMYGLVRADEDAIQIGQRVEAIFEQVTDEVTMVRWRPLL